MKRSVIGVNAGIVAFSVVIGLMLILGAVHPSKAREYLMPTPCQRLCWNGIIIGHTSFQDSKRILENKGYTVTLDEQNSQFWNPALKWLDVGFVWHVSSTQNVASVELEPHPDTIHLGDAILLFGKPSAYSICYYDEQSVPSGAFVSLYFPSGIYVSSFQASDFTAGGTWQFNPTQDIDGVVFFDRNIKYDLSAYIPWHGF